MDDGVVGFRSFGVETTIDVQYVVVMYVFTPRNSERRHALIVSRRDVDVAGRADIIVVNDVSCG